MVLKKGAIYAPVIGLEIHIQLKTRTKMFCDSLNVPLEREPNIHICPVCSGQPGALPVMNKEAVKAVIKAGLALNCKIQKESWFERKNYFYPDLPKGYQISQYESPLCYEGFLNLPIDINSAESRKIFIRRIHLEEDTGKLIHSSDKKSVLIDFNRAGIPLMELVTDPDIRSGSEARRFAESLQLIFRYLDISDADMEKGMMRVEVNISLGKKKNKELVKGTKVEIKNLNSFRSVEKSINYEIKRQAELLRKGKKIIQETRGWDEKSGKTVSQRKKEEAQEYRYFPEPDLPLLWIIHNKNDEAGIELHEQVLDLREIMAAIPELPLAREKRFVGNYNLPIKLAKVLVVQKEKGEYFEQAVSELAQMESYEEVIGDTQKHLSRLYNLAANYLITELSRVSQDLGEEKEDFGRIDPKNFAELLIMIHIGKVSSSAAQAILKIMHNNNGRPLEIAREMGLEQVSDEKELDSMIEKVIIINEQAVADYKSGNEQVIQFLVGQVMKESKGKANPQVVRQILISKL